MGNKTSNPKKYFDYTTGNSIDPVTHDKLCIYYKYKEKCSEKSSLLADICDCDKDLENKINFIL